MSYNTCSLDEITILVHWGVRHYEFCPQNPISRAGIHGDFFFGNYWYLSASTDEISALYYFAPGKTLKRLDYCIRHGIPEDASSEG